MKTKNIITIRTSHSIHLSLINNERRNTRVLSAKACGYYYLDTEPCYNGASDRCYQQDSSGCGGSQAIDECKYIDEESCYGYKAHDYCSWDYDNGNNCAGSDFCLFTDN